MPAAPADARLWPVCVQLRVNLEKDINRVRKQYAKRSSALETCRATKLGQPAPPKR